MVKKDIFWFYGFSGSGKTTLGRMFVDVLEAKGYEVAFLDGDVTRKKHTPKSFTNRGRFDNIIDMMFLAEEEADKGKKVVACFITPLYGMRAMIKTWLGDRLCLIYVVADETVCWKRDPKGLYKKFIEGKISNFSGADLRFDVPLADNTTVIVWGMDRTPFVSITELIEKIGEMDYTY